ncbi:DUF2617 family protein [Actinophytocola sp.]|uniref:DUF2617 family protein n=1 Tax=Actinophytocola sp. TaxID=1872138 RepID=UPI003D6C6165
MRARIDTRFADSRAADLSLAYGLPRLHALGAHRVALHGMDVELCLLGASHQVIVGPWSETVACLPDRADTLPAREEVVSGGLRVQFAAQTLRLDEFYLAERVAMIARDCAADPQALVGEFPGDPLAITALRAWEEKDGTAWRTWHAYPQAGELVETRTMVRPA